MNKNRCAVNPVRLGLGVQITATASLFSGSKGDGEMSNSSVPPSVRATSVFRAELAKERQKADLYTHFQTRPRKSGWIKSCYKFSSVQLKCISFTTQIRERKNVFIINMAWPWNTTTTIWMGGVFQPSIVPTVSAPTGHYGVYRQTRSSFHCRQIEHVNKVCSTSATLTWPVISGTDM